MGGHDLLFQSGDLRATLENYGNALTAEVNKVPEEHLLKVDEDEWVRALVERYSVEAPVLHGDKAWMDKPQEVQVDVSWDHVNRFIEDPSTPTYVPGYRTAAHIPFTGEKDVFLLRPSTWNLNPPRAEVAEDELRLVIEYPSDRPVNIKARTKQLADAVEQHLGWARGDIEQYNRSLEAKARRAIDARRDRVRRNYEHLQATGLPMGPPEESPKTYIAEAIVRRPAPALARTPLEQPMALEPVLSDAVFEHILGVIRLTGRGMEQSPGTYRGMGEEDRRQVILIALNTHYRGRGTAEAFNVGGKTDILIPHEGSNLFIGECKFWSGAKGFTEAIDQLFEYRGWRDTKLALIVFVREKDLTSIIEKANDALVRHPQFVGWRQADDETELRASVSWPGDDRRHADLNVFFVSTPAG